MVMTKTQKAPAPGAAGGKQWMGLAALTCAPIVVSMDLTVLYFAVPSISASLHPTSTQQLWMVDIYGFLLASLLITMGTIGDRIGRRLLLMLGSSAFAIASTVAAFSKNPEMLIGARAAQGVAAATLMPSAIALVRVLFPDEKQRRSAIAMFSTGMALGTGLGPVISGALLSNFWWGSIFLINLPIIGVMLVAVPFLVPEFKMPKARRSKLSLVSTVLSVAAVLSFVWGISEWATDGYSRVRVGGVVLGVLLAIVMVLYQSRLKDPMIDLKLFKYRGFGPVLLLSMTAFFCVIGFGLFSTQYLLDVIALTPMIAGVWMLVTPVLTGAMAPTAAQLVNKVKPAYVIAAAMLVAAAGFGLMTQLTTAKQLWLIIPGIALIGAGTSTTLVLLTDIVVTVAPPERAGATTALQRTFQELGGASGIAIFGSIGAAVYGRKLNAVLPSAKSLPPQIHGTFGATVAAAQAEPGGKGAALTAAAREAFTHSVNVGAEIGVAITVVAALFALSRLSHLSYSAAKTPPNQEPKKGGKTRPVPQRS